MPNDRTRRDLSFSTVGYVSTDPETQRVQQSRIEQNVRQTFDDARRLGAHRLAPTPIGRQGTIIAQVGQLLRIDPTLEPTVRLPRVTPDEAGRQLVIKNTTNSTADIRVAATPPSTIDGHAEIVLSGAQLQATLTFDGQHWTSGHTRPGDADDVRMTDASGTRQRWGKLMSANLSAFAGILPMQLLQGGNGNVLLGGMLANVWGKITDSHVANAAGIATSKLALTPGAGDAGRALRATGADTVSYSTMPLYTGAGSPEGVITAPVGSLYTDTGGAAGTTLYVKESGAGNVGWAAK